MTRLVFQAGLRFRSLKSNWRVDRFWGVILFVNLLSEKRFVSAGPLKLPASDAPEADFTCFYQLGSKKNHYTLTIVNAMDEWALVESCLPKIQSVAS